MTDLQKCIEQLRIIQGNPIDKKLLKQELKRDFNEALIRKAKKILKDN